MKGILGCCYQCDVPPETIQNLRISWLRNRLYLHMVYLLTQCATTTRKIFLFFFLGGPTQSVQAFFGWARPVGSSFQAVKKFIFTGQLDAWD